MSDASASASQEGVSVSVSEQIYSVIVMWCGSAVFAKVVADMTIITSNITKRKTELREQMLYVHEFMETYKLPDFMQRSMTMHFETKIQPSCSRRCLKRSRTVYAVSCLKCMITPGFLPWTRPS